MNAEAIDHSDARASPVGDVELACYGTNRHAFNVVHI